ncbi:4316_t:CDS:2, partial [Acaulospora morrowiae]
TWKGQTVSNACYEFFHESKRLGTHLRMKRKHNELAEDTFLKMRNTSKTSERNTNTSISEHDTLDTTNKRQMSDEKVIQYLDAMEQSLECSQVNMQRPSLWTESLNSYVDNVLKKSEDGFKVEILQKIKGDEGNKFRLYCEKILMDFYNLVDIFPNISRKIGERKYIVQNVSSLFKFYESTFGNLHFDWIETHSPASKLDIVKVDAKGVRVFDDKEIFHAEVSGPPSSSSSQH